MGEIKRMGPMFPGADDNPKRRIPLICERLGLEEVTCIQGDLNRKRREDVFLIRVNGVWRVKDPVWGDRYGLQFVDIFRYEGGIDYCFGVLSPTSGFDKEAPGIMMSIKSLRVLAANDLLGVDRIEYEDRFRNQWLVRLGIDGKVVGEDMVHPIFWMQAAYL